MNTTEKVSLAIRYLILALLVVGTVWGFISGQVLIVVLGLVGVALNLVIVVRTTQEIGRRRQARSATEES